MATQIRTDQIENFAAEVAAIAAQALAGLPTATITGDFLRWNDTTEQWEIASEPLELKQIVMTPSAGPLVNIEGGMYYDAATKTVLICTEE